MVLEILMTDTSFGIVKATTFRLIADWHIVYDAAQPVANMQDLVDAGGHAIELDEYKEEQVVTAVERTVEDSH